MGSITDFLEDELLDHVFNVAFVPTVPTYLCLCTADPTDAATGASMSEVANTNGYVRTAIVWHAAASRVLDQDGAVDFPQASGGAWGTVTDWAICDSNTYGNGNVLAYGAFTESKTINDGNTPSIADSEIDVTFSVGEISDYLANKLLDLAFKNTAYSKPVTYIALCTAVLVDSDTTLAGDEVANAGAYARKQVNINGGAAPDWNISSSGAVDSSDSIDFVTATASWGTVVAVAICDSGTWNAGEMLFYDNDMADQAVGNGDTAKFPATTLDITMT